MRSVKTEGPGSLCRADFVFLVDVVGEDELQVVETEVGGKAFIAQHVGDELRFLVLKNADFLLDRVAGEQAVGDDLVFLSDPVGSVDGLVFHGGVPPGIVEDDVGSGSEVESRTARLERDKEYRHRLVAVEVIDLVLTVLGGAGSLKDIQALFASFGILGAAAGSLFVFKGVYRAVLINYPSRADKDGLIAHTNA